jgi:hypothetical protein
VTQDLLQALQGALSHHEMARKSMPQVVEAKIFYPCLPASYVEGNFDIANSFTVLIAEKVLGLKLISFPNTLSSSSRSLLRGICLASSIFVLER